MCRSIAPLAQQLLLHVNARALELMLFVRLQRNLRMACSVEKTLCPKLGIARCIWQRSEFRGRAPRPGSSWTSCRCPRSILSPDANEEGSLGAFGGEHALKQ